MVNFLGHRNRWLRLNMTEKLFTGTLNHNQNKNKKTSDNKVPHDISILLDYPASYCARIEKTNNRVLFLKNNTGFSRILFPFLTRLMSKMKALTRVFMYSLVC